MSTPEEARYQVLARKYRPATFADLIGQDAMVRTLKNAFAADRIAHAFILTGVRGVGKTTTARIIAKGLNCVGPDGQGGPTTEACGVCEPCRAIAAGRHVDVLEMDAASHTGVGDIREILDGVNFRAASARYKVYVIDEVHMLSTSAFNALLKTLEEPPAHVKFIFATTEIRKVPVTVMSRCQRFDLRRIEAEAMIPHLAGIAAKEDVAAEEEALALVTRAAEGSVRDALSLLDQAIAQGQGRVTAEDVRAMLGLADRGRVFDLFGRIMDGDAAGALAEVSAQYAEGADPAQILRDLAEATHWVSILKVTPAAAEDPTVTPAERDRGREMADRLDLRPLTRMWQMCLKALEEVAAAPAPMMACEMAVIRMTHVADLPTPGDLVRRLQAAPPPARPAAPGGEARARARPGGRRGAGRGRAARLAARGGRRAPPRPRRRGARPAGALCRIRGRGGADPRTARRAPAGGRGGGPAAGALFPGPDRVPARRRRARGPGGAAGPAVAGLDRGALGGQRRCRGRRRDAGRGARPAPHRSGRPGDAPSHGAGGDRGLPRRQRRRHPRGGTGAGGGPDRGRAGGLGPAGRFRIDRAAPAPLWRGGGDRMCQAGEPRRWQRCSRGWAAWAIFPS